MYLLFINITLDMHIKKRETATIFAFGMMNFLYYILLIKGFVLCHFQINRNTVFRLLIYVFRFIIGIYFSAVIVVSGTTEQSTDTLVSTSDSHEAALKLPVLIFCRQAADDMTFYS